MSLLECNSQLPCQFLLDKLAMPQLDSLICLKENYKEDTFCSTHILSYIKKKSKFSHISKSLMPCKLIPDDILFLI